MRHGEPMQPHLQPSAAQLEQPLRAQDGRDVALSLDETARRLGVGVRTFYSREATGWWRRLGLVELPRPSKHHKRLFSAASVERIVRHAGQPTARPRVPASPFCGQ